MQNISKSQNFFNKAKDLIPGGVNSPVRAFNSVGGIPRFIQKANGPYLYDVMATDILIQFAPGDRLS